MAASARLMAALIWGACGPRYHGRRLISAGRAPVARSRAEPGAGRGCRRLEDLLAAQGDLLAGAAVAVADRHDRHVVLAGQGGQVPGVPRVIDAGADDLLGRRAPQRGHAGLAPHRDALLVGLQDGDRHHAARAQMGVQLGQVADPADVGGLVQDDRHGRVEPPAGRSAWRRPARITVSVSAAISGDAADRNSVSRYRVSGRPRTRPGRTRAGPCRAAARPSVMMSSSLMHFAAVRAVW